LNRFGKEKNQTEPNRTEINLFEPVFGSVRFKKLKKNRFGYLFWFKTGLNRKCSALIHMLGLLGLHAFSLLVYMFNYDGLSKLVSVDFFS
jgi:hypothetical protein